MGEAILRLREHLGDIHNLDKAFAVLAWEKVTYMPPGGGTARTNQMASLSKLSHQLFTSETTEHLLQEAEREAAAAHLSSDEPDAALLRLARRDRDRAVRIPPALITQMTQTAGVAREVWAQARATNNFPLFSPWLQKIVDLHRQLVEHVGYTERPYDALLDDSEPGMTTKTLSTLFEGLRAELIPLVRDVSARAASIDDSVLHRSFDEETQLRFSREVAASLGYDLQRGRLDLTVHPFEVAFSRDDVRITTRVSPTFLSMCLMGTMHETGHGLYEQGIGADLEGTLLGRGASPGLHESQSRLWENLIGHSHSFWTYYFPRLQQAFPASLGDVDVETFYRAINKVQPSLIRVEADELTYNLHIMLRFELENELLEGRLAAEDVPAAWNAKMQEYLGLTPPNDTQGALQDVHWSMRLGGFPGYALGNIISVQIFDAALTAHPSIREEIATGNFSTLLGWLQQHIYRHGRIYDPSDLVQRVTGEPLQTRSYLRYLHEKFGAIYGLS